MHSPMAQTLRAQQTRAETGGLLNSLAHGLRVQTRINAPSIQPEARFADGSPESLPADAGPLPGRLLARRTVRRYADAAPDEALLDALTAAALCASSKSDFQQASIRFCRNSAIGSANRVVCR